MKKRRKERSTFPVYWEEGGAEKVFMEEMSALRICLKDLDIYSESFQEMEALIYKYADLKSYNPSPS